MLLYVNFPAELKMKYMHHLFYDIILNSRPFQSLYLHKFSWQFSIYIVEIVEYIILKKIGKHLVIHVVISKNGINLNDLKNTVFILNKLFFCV